MSHITAWCSFSSNIWTLCHPWLWAIMKFSVASSKIIKKSTQSFYYQKSSCIWVAVTICFKTRRVRVWFLVVKSVFYFHNLCQKKSSRMHAEISVSGGLHTAKGTSCTKGLAHKAIKTMHCCIAPIKTFRLYFSCQNSPLLIFIFKLLTQIAFHGVLLLTTNFYKTTTSLTNLEQNVHLHPNSGLHCESTKQLLQD